MTPDSEQIWILNQDGGETTGPLRNLKLLQQKMILNLTIQVGQALHVIQTCE